MYQRRHPFTGTGEPKRLNATFRLEVAPDHGEHRLVYQVKGTGDE